MTKCQPRTTRRAFSLTLAVTRPHSSPGRRDPVQFEGRPRVPGLGSTSFLRGCGWPTHHRTRCSGGYRTAIQSNSSMRRYECVALCKYLSLHRGRLCATTLASYIPRSSEDGSSWMLFIWVVRGRPVVAPSSPEEFRRRLGYGTAASISGRISTTFEASWVQPKKSRRTTIWQSENVSN